MSYLFPVRFIAVFFSLLSLTALALTMVAGLKAGRGQEFYVSHLYWAFGSIGLVALTQTLCLMFIFKMHSIMHMLVRRLDEKDGYPEEGSSLQ